MLVLDKWKQIHTRHFYEVYHAHLDAMTETYCKLWSIYHHLWSIYHRLWSIIIVYSECTCLRMMPSAPTPGLNEKAMPIL